MKSHDESCSYVCGENRVLLLRNERIVQGEGPFGVIVCPSRELAQQTYGNDVAESLILVLRHVD